MPGANIGPHASVWEQGARHVGADIAGQGKANPIAALLSSAMMLRHLSLADYTDRLEAAVLGAVADLPPSAKTPDIGGTGTTATFMKEVLERLEREAGAPAHLDDLPLFATVAEPAAKFGPSPVDEAVRAMDPDGMSPREAMDALYRLKGLL